MAARWSIGKKLAIGFFLASIAPLIIGFVSYRNTLALIENESWVDHTQQVLQQLPQLVSKIEDVETEQRAYALHRDFPTLTFHKFFLAWPLRKTKNRCLAIT